MSGFEEYLFCRILGLFDVGAESGQKLENVGFQKFAITLRLGGYRGQPAYQRGCKGPEKVISGLRFDFYGIADFLGTKI